MKVCTRIGVCLVVCHSSHYDMVNMMKILTIAILFSQWHNSKVSIISSLLSDFTPLCLWLQDIHALLFSIVWLLTGLWFHYLSSIPRMLYQCYQCFWEHCNHSLYQTCCQWSKTKWNSLPLGCNNTHTCIS